MEWKTTNLETPTQATVQINHNEISISDNSTVTHKIFGGYAAVEDDGTGSVSSNRVVIEDSTVNEVFGAHSEKSIVSGNSVSITGSKTGNIYGGHSSSGEVSGNSITLTNSTVSGTVYAGYSGGVVKNNTVSITGANDLSAATLYGSSKKNAAVSRSSGNTGNRLNMTGYSGKMQNIGNFNWVDLSLDGIALSEEKPVIELTTGTTDFSWTSVNIHTSADYAEAEGDGLKDRYELIANTNSSSDGGMTAENITLVNKELRIRNGFSRNAVYDIVYDGENSIDAVKNHDELLPGTDIFTEDQLAVAGFLSAGLDFALDRKLDCSVTKDGTIPERCVYVDVRGEKLRHEARSGATLRTTGTHYVLGLKGKLNDREDVEKDVNGAIYLEAGRSNLRARTQWAKGDGDGEYYGLGLIAEYRRHEGDFKGSYLQLHGRIGKASSDYKGLVYDAGTGYVGYDENRTYWGYGLEAGYEWDVNESTRLDFAARYRALTLEGFTDRIAGDRYEIDDLESHRTHLGLRLNYTGRKGMVPYIGAAWEYEFDSKVRGRAEGLELAEDSLKGSTGVGEIGIKINPSEDSRWTFDGSLKGYIGRTEGVAASLYASYLFD